MEHDYDDLLGLDLETALRALQNAGLADVEIVFTAAPPRKNLAPEETYRSDEGERRGYASTRVVAVRDGGRTLIVSRFLTGSPLNRQKHEPPVEADAHHDIGRTADE